MVERWRQLIGQLLHGRASETNDFLLTLLDNIIARPIVMMRFLPSTRWTNCSRESPSPCKSARPISHL